MNVKLYCKELWVVIKTRKALYKYKSIYHLGEFTCLQPKWKESEEEEWGWKGESMEEEEEEEENVLKEEEDQIYQMKSTQH